MKTTQPAKLCQHVLVATVAFLVSSTAPSGGQALYKTIRPFGIFELSSATPIGALVEGTNGSLYGASEEGGQFGVGTVFRLNKDGSQFAVIMSFQGTNGDGSSPWGGLLLASNGFLYGTTHSGGDSNAGTIFRIDHGGSNYAIIKSFTGATNDAASPASTLMQASNGQLYGTTVSGGAYNLGTVFSLNPDGSGFAVLKSFAGGANDGARPRVALVQGTNGLLFGTTASGGISNIGTIFTLHLDGGGFTLVRSFSGGSNDGSTPWAELLLATNNILYGATAMGGSNNVGTVFQIGQDGEGYSLITSFTGGDPTGYFGAGPVYLMQAANGLIYGTTENAGTYTNGTLFRFSPDGSGYTILKQFGSTASDGAEPTGTLLQASDGALYGVARSGGWIDVDETTHGTAFRIDLDGNDYTVIWHFSGTGGDGTWPEGPVVEGTNGSLCGVTQEGGAYDQGTIFKVNRDGSGYILLKSFAGTNLNPNLPEGASPSAGLLVGPDGALYGTTSCDYTYQRLYGNAYQTWYSSISIGHGVIFRINADGTGYQILKRFLGSDDGGDPYGGLTLATNGLLYGANIRGGPNGYGVIFRFERSGSGFTVLTNFSNNSIGFQCMGGMMQASDGALYGTAVAGGTGGVGTVFTLGLDGRGFRAIKSFDGGNGSYPHERLIQGLDGALYGSTSQGGNRSGGTLFKLNLDGTGFATLRHFPGKNGDGSWPVGALVQSPNGILYGVTSQGGTYGAGIMYQISPDGTGYTILYNFQGTPLAGLMLASDGAFYDTMYGLIYSLLPPTIMRSPSPSGTASQLSFLGVAGRTYGIQRAPSPSGPWSDLGTSLVNSNGVGAFQDLTPLPTNAFYRTSFHW